MKLRMAESMMVPKKATRVIFSRLALIRKSAVPKSKVSIRDTFPVQQATTIGAAARKRSCTSVAHCVSIGPAINYPVAIAEKPQRNYNEDWLVGFEGRQINAAC